MLKRILLSLLITAILVLTCGYFLLFASLPVLHGTYVFSKLESPVTVHRDNLGIPTIQAHSRLDIAKATGFIHAQDRLFQMDLLRRNAAGELAELLGEKALQHDKKQRFHRFRKRAEEIYQQLSTADQTLLNAYTDGVNFGINSFLIYPFEYLLTLTKPRPWKPEDSLLVCFGLFLELQDYKANSTISDLVMKRCLPQEVYAFFAHNGSYWEAPLDSSKIPILPIPEEKTFEYLKKNDVPSLITRKPNDHHAGSNQWVVTNNKSATSKAILACDMHLNVSIPNIWYRAAFLYRDSGMDVKVYGATLPGTPLMILGSNTHIAWGFTNSCIQTSSPIFLSSNIPIQNVKEIIQIKNKNPISVEIEESPLGPVLSETLFGKKIAIEWTAYQKDAINLRLIDLEKAESVKKALEISPSVNIPLLNFLVADKNANIAWTLMGTTGKKMPPPVILNPFQNAIWTANNRTVGSKDYSLNSISFANGIRAHQIRHHLMKQKAFSESDMFNLQMLVEAPFFKRWQKLMIDLLTPSTNQLHLELLQEINLWDGKCNTNSLGYYYIREFRKLVMGKLSRRFLAPCFSVYPYFLEYPQDLEEPLWLIVSEQRKDLADPNIGDWRTELLQYIDELIAAQKGNLKGVTWGQKNSFVMDHPFSAAMSYLGSFLNMNQSQMSGDYYVPKVARGNFCASQRMVISPGVEEKGIFQMPGGQSGHPLSPFFQYGHKDWLEGSPSPFLPQTPIYTLKLLNKKI